MTTWIKQRLHDRLVQQTMLLFTMRVLGTGLGFLFWVLAARFISSAQMGIASGAVAGTALLASLAQLGLGYVLVRHLSRSANPGALVNRALIIVGSVALLAATVFLLGASRWSPELRPLRTTLLTSALFLLLVGSTALSQLLHWVFLACRQLNYSLAKQICQSLLALLLLWLCRPLGGYLTVLVAYVGATLAALLLAWIAFLPRVIPRYAPRWPGTLRIQRAALFEALPNYCADQLQRAPDTILPLIALHTLGPNGGATFFIVWSLGSSMSSWACAVAESLLTEGMHTPALVPHYARRATRLGLLLMTGMGLALMLASRSVLSLYGVTYAGTGRWLLLAVTVSGVPWVLNSLQVSRLRIVRRHRAVMGLMLSSNGLGIVVAGALMAYGMVWAGLGWLAVQTSICALTYLWPQPTPAMAVEHSIG